MNSNGSPDTVASAYAKQSPKFKAAATARAGDLDAYGDLVGATQAMAYGVARGVLRDAALAEDAAQEAYLRGVPAPQGSR